MNFCRITKNACFSAVWVVSLCWPMVTFAQEGMSKNIDTQQVQHLQQAEPAQAVTTPTKQTSSRLEQMLEQQRQAQIARRDKALSSVRQKEGSKDSQKQTRPTTATTKQQFPRQKMQKAAATSMSNIDLRQEAFSNTLNNLLPLSPEQIVALRHMYRQTKFAAATSPSTPPKPTSTSQFVSLAPGATPPAIRLSAGFVSSLVFLDSTGAPWPITAYDLGNPKAFDIQWDKKDNTLMVQASSLYTYGNLAVRLKGLTTPVMLTLIPGQKDVDYRVELRVQGLGPEAKPVLSGGGLPSGANPVLLGVLDGVGPTGSQRLKVSGGQAQAWLSGGKIFFRSRLTVLSPGWLSIMNSADGTKAYELPRTPNVLVSANGKPVLLKIQGL